MTPVISSVRYKRATAAQRREGLEGWISFVLNGQFAVDGVALRRGRLGRLALSWPARKDGGGHQHHYLRPLHTQARHVVEGELLAQLYPLIRGDAA